MEGPSRGEETEKKERMRRYIESKVAYFWGYPASFDPEDEENDALGDMVGMRYYLDADTDLVNERGVTADQLRVAYENDEVEISGFYEAWELVTTQIDGLISDPDSYIDMINNRGGLEDAEFGGPDLQEFGFTHVEVLTLPGAADFFTFQMKQLLIDLDLTTTNRAPIEKIIRSIVKTHTEDRLFPLGISVEEVVEEAREYIPWLKAKIEQAIRDENARAQLEYKVFRELFYRFSAGMLGKRERRGVGIKRLKTLLMEEIARRSVVDQLVHERNIRRAENTMMRYYLLDRLREERGEQLSFPALLPSELVVYISSFVRNIWPDAFLEFELANTFESYLRSRSLKFRETEVTLPEIGSDTSLFPEEQKSKIQPLMTLVEVIVQRVVETSPKERKSFYEKKRAEVEAIGNRLTRIQEDFNQLRDMDLRPFYEYIVRVTKAHPSKLSSSELQQKLRDPESEISPTEIQLERLHIVVAEFGRRDTVGFLRKMIEENVAAVAVYSEELDQQRKAITDALLMGLPRRSRRLVTPPSKRIRKTKARYQLDYSRAPSASAALLSAEKARGRERCVDARAHGPEKTALRNALFF